MYRALRDKVEGLISYQVTKDRKIRLNFTESRESGQFQKEENALLKGTLDALRRDGPAQKV